MLIVAWREITSGARGCSLVTSSFLRSCSINPRRAIFASAKSTAEAWNWIEGNSVSMDQYHQRPTSSNAASPSRIPPSRRGNPSQSPHQIKDETNEIPRSWTAKGNKNATPPPALSLWLSLIYYCRILDLVIYIIYWEHKTGVGPHGLNVYRAASGLGAAVSGGLRGGGDSVSKRPLLPK